MLGEGIQSASELNCELQISMAAFQYRPSN